MTLRPAVLVATLIMVGCAPESPPPPRVAPPPAPPANPAETILQPAQAAAYVDRLARDLGTRMAASGIAIERRGGELRLELPAGALFDFNSTALRPTFRTALDQLGQALGQFPAIRVEIGGHSDATGTDEVNQRLSEARAASVAAALARVGVASGRITARGFGKARPIAPNDTDDGRARNRRVEIILSAATSPPSPRRPGY